MAHVTIENTPSFVKYDVTTSDDGPFTVPFATFEDDGADLKVEVDGVDIGSAFTYVATSSTTGGNQAGTVTLDVAVSNAEVLIYRNIVPARTSDYGTGPLPREAVNNEFDKMQAQIADLRRDVNRSYKADFGDTIDADVSEAVEQVAAIADEVEQVAAIDAEVVIVAGAIADVESVADHIGDVVDVADVINGGGITTGTGSFVRATSPTLVTPALGTPASGNLANCTGYPSVREVLSGLRYYYVRTDGSDSNTGLVDSAGGAFLTLQKAVDTVWQTLDLNGNNVIIDIGNGTYTAGADIVGAPIGEGLVYFIGDTSTPSNVVVSVTGDDCFSGTYGARFSVRGVKMQTTTSGHCIKAYLGSFVDFQSVNFGACAEMHVECGTGSTIIADGAYTISGGAMGHLHCGSFGNISSALFTVTITGTPAFSSYFAGAAQGSIIITGMTFSGSATGVRYLAHRGGVISAAAVDPALPGDTAGRVATGGVYRASVVNPFAIAPDTGVNDSVVLYSRDTDTGAYVPRVDLRSDSNANGYFYFNGDDCYSSGQTHFGSATEVVVASGTQDGFTVKSAAALASNFYCFSASANAAAVGYMRRRTSAGDALVFLNDNTVSGSISVNGAATAYNTSSDKRLKEDLGLYDDAGALAKILAVQIHNFRWTHLGGDHRDVGAFAQDLYDVLPMAVKRGDSNPDARPGNPQFENWGVDYSKLVPYLVCSIRHLAARIAELETP